MSVKEEFYQDHSGQNVCGGNVGILGYGADHIHGCVGICISPFGCDISEPAGRVLPNLLRCKINGWISTEIDLHRNIFGERLRVE